MSASLRKPGGGEAQTVIVPRWLDTSFASGNQLILIRFSQMANSNVILAEMRKSRVLIQRWKNESSIHPSIRPSTVFISIRNPTLSLSLSLSIYIYIYIYDRQEILKIYNLLYEKMIKACNIHYINIYISAVKSFCLHNICVIYVCVLCICVMYI